MPGVLEVSDAGLELTSNSDNAVGFGDASTASCSVTVRRAAISLTAWERVGVRITFTRSGVAAFQFSGVITDYTGDLDTVEFRCEGLAVLIARTPVYSPAFYRRPAATRTTASS